MNDIPLSETKWKYSSIASATAQLGTKLQLQLQFSMTPSVSFSHSKFWCASKLPPIIRIVSIEHCMIIYALWKKLQGKRQAQGEDEKVLSNFRLIKFSRIISFHGQSYTVIIYLPLTKRVRGRALSYGPSFFFQIEEQDFDSLKLLNKWAVKWNTVRLIDCSRVSSSRNWRVQFNNTTSLISIWSQAIGKRPNAHSQPCLYVMRHDNSTCTH